MLAHKNNSLDEQLCKRKNEMTQRYILYLNNII